MRHSCRRKAITYFCQQVLTLAPVEAGLEVVHYMYPGPFGSSLEVMGGEGLRARGPRLLSNKPLSTGKEWKKCVLRIVDTKVTDKPLTHYLDLAQGKLNPGLTASQCAPELLYTYFARSSSAQHSQT